MTKDAIISECGKYRYWLSRRWAEGGLTLNFCLLNPSTADASIDDPTVGRLVGFAKSFNYNAFTLVNAFAWRATNPKELAKLTYAVAVGPENDKYILKAATEADATVLAYGATPTRGRAQEVKRLLQRNGINPMAVRLTKSGRPEHPLYLPATCQMVAL